MRTDVIHLRLEGILSLDKTDKRILAALAGNARISFAALGREIGLSRTAVQDRVAKLEHSGVIQGYQASISETHTELVRAMLFVRIASRPCSPALTWLASLEGVHEVFSLAGDIDAILKCAVPSPQALAALNDRIGSSDLILSSQAQIILSRR